MVIGCRTRRFQGSPVLITRTQHYDADSTLLQYAETITLPNWALTTASSSGTDRTVDARRSLALRTVPSSFAVDMCRRP